MRAVIIAGGVICEPDFYKSFIQEDDFVICADRGYLHAKKIGVVPDLVIGDFDSCPREKVGEGVPVRLLPVEKDRTDLHECILHAIEKGAKEILVFGALGGRLDHSLATVSLVYMAFCMGVRVRLINEQNELFMFSGSVEVKRKEGYKLSLLPYGTAEGIHTTGLYYALHGEHMEPDNPYGVSNEFTEEVATISVEKGTLMVLLCRD